jgi:hypothetical protein
VRVIIRWLGILIFLVVAVGATAFLVPWGKGMMANAVSGAAGGELTVSAGTFQGNPLRGMSVHNLQIAERERMVMTIPNAVVRLDFLSPGREIVAIIRDFEARFARKSGEKWSLHLPDRRVRLQMANGQFSYVWNDIPVKGTVNGEVRILPDKVQVRDLDLFAFSTKTITSGTFERASGDYHYETKVGGLSADTLTLLLATELPDLKELQLGAVMDGTLTLQRTGEAVGVSGTLSTPKAFLRRMEWANIRTDLSFTGLTLALTNGSGEALGGKVSEVGADLAFPRPGTSATASPPGGLVADPEVGLASVARKKPTTYKVSGNLQGIVPRDLLKRLGIAEKADVTGGLEGSFHLEGVLGDALNSTGKGRFSISAGECNIPGEENPVRLKAVDAEWEYNGDIFRVKRLMVVGPDEDFYIAGQVLLDRGGRNAAGTGVVIVREPDTLRSLPDEVRRFFRLMTAPIPSPNTRKMALVRLRGPASAPIVYFTPGPATVIELTGESYEERLQSVWRHYENSRLSLF